MNSMVWILCLAIALAIPGASLPVSAQSSPLTFKVWAAPAPNRYTAKNGVAWTSYHSWVSRALDSILNNKGNVGDPATEPHALQFVNSIVPRMWAVSGVESWRGQLNPTGAFDDQYGNAMHFLLHVKGDGTVRFKYEDLSWCVWRTGQKGGVVCNTMKLVKPDSGAAWDRIDCTYGTGYDWGADKKKGGGDDSEVCGGDQTDRGTYDATLVDEVFYIGATFASAADYRYNNPTLWPEYVDYTVQEVFDEFCQRYNNDAGYRELGLEFTLAASDGNTYNYVATRTNREFGRNMQPGLCIPYPIPPTPAPAPTDSAEAATVCTGQDLEEQGYEIRVQYGLCSGAQFQLPGARGVGNQEVLDAGYIDAVDVWAYAEQSIEVCFPSEEGALVFLDSMKTPHAVGPAQTTRKAGRLCAAIQGPGTIVQVESWAEAAAPAHNSNSLGQCMVTTQHLLNFRDGPGGSVIGGVPYNATLTALGRADGWFQVDYHGATGWISADYVTTAGDCS